MRINHVYESVNRPLTLLGVERRLFFFTALPLRGLAKNLSRPRVKPANERESSPRCEIIDEGGKETDAAESWTAEGQSGNREDNGVTMFSFSISAPESDWTLPDILAAEGIIPTLEERIEQAAAVKTSVP
jgi:hypothetical protein